MTTAQTNRSRDGGGEGGGVGVGVGRGGAACRRILCRHAANAVALSAAPTDRRFSVGGGGTFDGPLQDDHSACSDAQSHSIAAWRVSAAVRSCSLALALVAAQDTFAATSAVAALILASAAAAAAFSLRVACSCPSPLATPPPSSTATASPILSANRATASAAAAFVRAAAAATADSLVAVSALAIESVASASMTEVTLSPAPLEGLSELRCFRLDATDAATTLAASWRAARFAATTTASACSAAIALAASVRSPALPTAPAGAGLSACITAAGVGVLCTSGASRSAMESSALFALFADAILHTPLNSCCVRC